MAERLGVEVIGPDDPCPCGGNVACGCPCHDGEASACAWEGKPTDGAYRAAAQRRYGSDRIEIDSDARVTRLDEEGPDQDAAWVQAWVFVDSLVAKEGES